MINTKNKIVTILLGLVAIGIIVWALGPIVRAFYSICIDVENRESKKNYRYVYPIPETSLYLQTYFYNDSLCTFVGSDTAINNCSHFSVWYKSDLTLVLLDVVNDSLVYLVDHNNEVDNICNKSVTIEQIPKGFYNHDFYDQKYTEESILYYVPKFHQIARISIYSGKVRANDSVVSPMIIKRETCEFLKNNPQPTKEQVLQQRSQNLIQKEFSTSLILNGIRNGSPVSMTSVFMHRTDWNGKANHSSKGCMIIDGRQWKNVEKQLQKSLNIYLRLIRQ